MLRDSCEFLEQALIEEGVVQEQQLVEARALAAEVSCPLSEAIVTLGFSSGKRIALTQALICEAPFIDLNEYEIDFNNSKILPKNIAEQHCVYPLFVLDGVVTVGTNDPLDLVSMDQVRQIVKCEVIPVQCESKLLTELISRAYSLSNTESADNSVIVVKHESKDEEVEQGPIVAAVNTLLADAVALGASDIHLNPDQHEMYLRLRIDGVLQLRQGPPLSMHSKIVQRIKVMAQLDLTQNRRPQDGKFRFIHNDKRVDIRTSIVPTVTGENVVLRLLNNNTSILSFSDLGIPEEIITSTREILAQPYGMYLVTGPTGSGKTTSLYTAISQMNTPDKNIMTIEDPVEVRLPMIRQIQVNHDIGLTFASALRAILRQDPDVVLLGEIRDEETAAIALQAALTGHFVFSTLHTNDSVGAIARLRDFKLASFVINSAVLGVLAQRLVRRVCPQCTEPDQPHEYVLKQFRLKNSTGFVRGHGCSECLQTGYRGRLGVYELLRFNPTIQSAIANEANAEELRKIMVADGSQLMWQDGLNKARSGLTTLSEVAKMVIVDSGTPSRSEDQLFKDCA